MTVVTTKRRPRAEGAGASDAETRVSTRRTEQNGQQNGEHHRHHSEAHHRSETGSGEARHRHRHYNDYGSLTLGELNESPEPAEDEVPAQTELTRGAIQREFYDKYDTVLSRRYFNRNKGKVTRVLVVAALISLVLLLVSISIGSLGKQGEEKLPRPSVETIPVATLDLG